jgi:hypothetical protein
VGPAYGDFGDVVAALEGDEEDLRVKALNPHWVSAN